jgi:mannose-6-phosphate isomerase class I
LKSSNSTYDKFPCTDLTDMQQFHFYGWNEIAAEISRQIKLKNKRRCIIAAEFNLGISPVIKQKLMRFLDIDSVFDTAKIFKTQAQINEMVYPFVTDDEVFGYMSSFVIEDFFDPARLKWFQKRLSEIADGNILIFGHGAALIEKPDILLYLDMPRWECQLRFRRNESCNLGVENFSERAALQYKRAYFVDWRVCDRLKKNIFSEMDFIIDSIDNENPQMVTNKTFLEGLKRTVHKPFRVMPFFDPGPWGGQWMKEICDLDRNEQNFAWCFDCVPEENSLLFNFGEYLFEMPALNLVLLFPEELLGKSTFKRFGAEFPIRFDFLDTMHGGNLSLQVHPTTHYIKEQFGMDYTQDESYYLMDAMQDASVYLGLKESCYPDEMLEALENSESTNEFDTEMYVEKWPAKKHDHFLIPAGTIHCSGANSMVLEISATPYIFTFKLWDWNRLGLDGRPRPINIKHGSQVIDCNRTTKWIKENLINQIELIEEGDGWREEKTGLHALEFIETRRHWFTKKVLHKNSNTVNVLNLVEGNEIIVESTQNLFKPFIVHYAETFIIPATISEYSIRPFGEKPSKIYATIKAFVRN